MKIRVNYDLLEKITIANKGFSLQKIVRNVVLYSSVNTLFWVPANMHFTTDWVQIILKDYIYFLLGYVLIFGFIDVTSKNAKMQSSIVDLNELVKELNAININTNYQLLLKAYEYYTNYSFVLDEDKIPRLKQDKYIMVPVVDRDGEKEVSLVQEHIVGTKEYELSYGNPKKELKLAYKPI